MRRNSRPGFTRTSAAVYEVVRQAPSGILSASSCAARTVRAGGVVPLCKCVLVALFPSILSPPPLAPHPTWGRAAAAKECSSARPSRDAPSARRCRKPSGRPACLWAGHGARTTVYPCGTGHGPSTFYRVRPWRPARPSKSPPFERTVPSQVHPAAQRRLSLRPGFPRRGVRGHTSSAPYRIGIVFDASVAIYAIAAAAALACRRAVESTFSRQSFSTAPSGSSPRST